MVNPHFEWRFKLENSTLDVKKQHQTFVLPKFLLVIVSGMYAVYHGPDGLKTIADQINKLTQLLASSLESAGYELMHSNYFDTIRFKADGWKKTANEMKLNFRDFNDGTVGISISEDTDMSQIKSILDVFNAKEKLPKSSSILSELKKRHPF